MESWLSWALFLAFLGASWYYYSHNNRVRHRGRPLQRASSTTTKADAIQWSDSEAKTKGRDRPTKAKGPRKSVKKAVQEAGDKVEAYLSAASSTAGVDADDDLSPVASPTWGTDNAPSAPSGRDVSDMLEPQGAAPSVLRINPSEKPVRQNKPQQQRAETPAETKKQRQNRKKAEEAKAQREADEKERQILLEKQRRTAREARGEPAKNGLQSAQAPTSNPWTTVRSAGAVAPAVHAPNGQHPGQLLDTFDPEVSSTASSSEANTNGTALTPESGHWNNLPSEEEQIRLALEDSAWTTVSKKQRKAKAAGEDDLSDSGMLQENTPTPSATVPAPTKKGPAKLAEASQPGSRYGLLAGDTKETHPLDSDWPVV